MGGMRSFRFVRHYDRETRSRAVVEFVEKTRDYTGDQMIFLLKEVHGITDYTPEAETALIKATEIYEANRAFKQRIVYSVAAVLLFIIGLGFFLAWRARGKGFTGGLKIYLFTIGGILALALLMAILSMFLFM